MIVVGTSVDQFQAGMIVVAELANHNLMVFGPPVGDNPCQETPYIANPVVIIL